jgi:hypothetical protein
VALVRERTIPTERPPLVSEVSAILCGWRGCRVVSVADPYGRNLGFIDRSHYVSFHEAEYTPFQTHYCSEMWWHWESIPDLLFCSQEL